MQLPIVPDFGTTARLAQGATMPSALVELNLPPSGDESATYVALSRVRHRKDLFILRPFNTDKLRRKGSKAAVDILLQEPWHLSGRAGRPPTDDPPPPAAAATSGSVHRPNRPGRPDRLQGSSGCVATSAMIRKAVNSAVGASNVKVSPLSYLRSPRTCDSGGAVRQVLNPDTPSPAPNSQAQSRSVTFVTTPPAPQPGPCNLKRVSPDTSAGRF
eukprot:gene13031-biopygen7621